jgi:hypothetical protein
MSHFAVLLTFGITSPILAVAICIAISSVTIFHQITIGRYLHFCQLQNQLRNQNQLCSPLHSQLPVNLAGQSLPVNSRSMSQTHHSHSFSFSQDVHLHVGAHVDVGVDVDVDVGAHVDVGAGVDFIALIKAQLRKGDLSGGLEGACVGILHGLPSCLWTILIASSMFFGYVIMDYAGDYIQWANSVYIAITTSLVPVMAWLVLKRTLMKANASTTTTSTSISIGQYRPSASASAFTSASANSIYANSIDRSSLLLSTPDRDMSARERLLSPTPSPSPSSGHMG